MSSKKEKPTKKSNEAQSKGLTVAMYFDILVKTLPKVFDLFVPKWQDMSSTITDAREKKKQSGKVCEEIASGLIERELHAFGSTMEEFNAFDTSRKKEIATFLKSNPAIKRKLHDIQQDMNKRLEEFMNAEKTLEISPAERAALAAIESSVAATRQDTGDSEGEAGPLKFEVKDGHVTGLDLSSMRLTEVPAGIEALKWLKTLNLSNNNLTAVRFDFGTLASLEELMLDFNHGLSSLPAGITSLTSLQRLELSGDFILPAAMSALTSLAQLALNGEPSFDRPPYQSRLTTLESLASIEALTGLEELKVTFCEAESIPPLITSMARLKTLDLSFSQLTSIPDAIGGLTSLETLNLANNKLVSVDPIGMLPSLFSLFLSGNQLATLPESLTSLKGLDYLDFDGNPIASLPAPVTAWIEDIKKRGGMVFGPSA